MIELRFENVLKVLRCDRLFLESDFVILEFREPVFDLSNEVRVGLDIFTKVKDSLLEDYLDDESSFLFLLHLIL